LIRAWANGLRTTYIHSMPGNVRSSVYRAWPVISSGSSFRKTPVPTYRWVTCAIPVTPLPARGRGVHLLGRGQDGLDDVLVAGASAQIAFQPEPDGLLGEVGVLRDEAGGGHDHPGRAVAALQPVVFVKGL